ncbi:MAG: zinc-ribbon domain containing protein [Chloroflexi bacterium]|nr:zinc-ribbon domain containing protein [Chloroflexota bacterium]
MLVTETVPQFSLLTQGGQALLSSYQDRVLTCKDCGNQFVFTAGEQEFFAARGLMHAPGRCPTCRAARKARNGTDGHGNYDNGGRAARGQRELYATVCSNCGKEALVPFVPRGDKPVYCSSCYEQIRSYR